MRGLIAAAVAVSVLVSGCASTGTAGPGSVANSGALIKDILVPTPLGIILKVSQHWFERNQHKVYYVQVRSNGRDFEDAKNRALRVATEHAVGVVVSSESVVENHQVVRNEIVAHSSGYVNDWNTVSERKTADGVEVTLDVWVSYLHLSERILVKGKDSNEVAGDKIVDARTSFRRQQETGRQLLEQVLRDFPARAVENKIVRTEGYLEGNPLVVKIESSWAEKYVKDFKTAVEHTTRPMYGCGVIGCRPNQGDKLIEIKVPGEFFIKYGSYDDTTHQLIIDHFFNSHPTLEVLLRDANNRIIHRDCVPLSMNVDGGFFSWSDRQGLRYRISSFRLEGNSGLITEYQMPNERVVAQTKRVEVNTMRLRECRK